MTDPQHCEYPVAVDRPKGGWQATHDRSKEEMQSEHAAGLRAEAPKLRQLRPQRA